MKKRKLLALIATIPLFAGLASFAACGGKSDSIELPEDQILKEETLTAERDTINYLLGEGIISQTLANHLTKNLDKMSNDEKLDMDEIFSIYEFCKGEIEHFDNEAVKKTAKEYLFETLKTTYIYGGVQGAKMLQELSNGNSTLIEANSLIIDKSNGHVEASDYRFVIAQDYVKINTAGGIAGVVKFGTDKAYLQSVGQTYSVVGGRAEQLSANSNADTSISAQIMPILQAQTENATDISYDGKNNYTLLASDEEGKTTKFTYTLDDDGVLLNYFRKVESAEVVDQAEVQYTPVEDEEFKAYYDEITSIIQDLQQESEVE